MPGKIFVWRFPGSGQLVMFEEGYSPGADWELVGEVHLRLDVDVPQPERAAEAQDTNGSEGGPEA